MTAAEMGTIWAQTVDRVKRVAHSPVLFRALERTHALAWEEGVFVVGFASADGQLSGTLNTGDHQATIERALRAVSGDSAVRLRIIEGSTIDDWERAKTRDAAAVAARAQTAQRKTVENAAFSSWDQVYDQISRLWAGFEYRSLPTGRARFFDAAFDLTVKAMASGMYPADGTTADEPTERGLARVIERIASMTGSDSALVAYLFWQRWKAQVNG